MCRTSTSRRSIPPRRRIFGEQKWVKAQIDRRSDSSQRPTGRTSAARRSRGTGRSCAAKMGKRMRCAGRPRNPAVYRTSTTGWAKRRTGKNSAAVMKKVWGPAQNAVYADVTGQYRLCHGGARADSQERTRRSSRARRYGRLRMDGIHSVRSVAASAQSRERTDRDRERARRRARRTNLISPITGKSRIARRASTICSATSTICAQSIC